MIAFYAVFALVMLLFGVKAFICYRQVLKTAPYAYDMPLAADQMPFWRYHKCNGKSRRKQCKKAFFKLKAKLKRRKKA